MQNHGFCMRLDARDGYADKISALAMVTDYVSIIGVRHKGVSGENPHYHLVVKTQIKDQAFRVRMKKVFDQGKGNGHMSIKPWDGCLDAISYLFHEDPDAQLVLRHNVSDETINEAKQRNEQVQREVAKSRERASWKLEDEVYQEFAKRKQEWIEDTSIAKELILMSFRTGRYMPNDFLLKSMVRRIQFRLLNGDTAKEEEFAQSLAEKVFLRYNT